MLSWFGFFVGFFLRVDSSRNWFVHISGAVAMSFLISAPASKDQFSASASHNSRMLAAVECSTNPAK
jgi:hypothetical protein